MELIVASSKAVAVLDGQIFSVSTSQDVLGGLDPRAVIFRGPADIAASKDPLEYISWHVSRDSLTGVGHPQDLWDALVSHAVELAEEPTRVKLARSASRGEQDMTEKVKKTKKITTGAPSARSINTASVITVLAEKNPRRASSKTHAIFELYKTGQTVADFIKAGGRLIDVKSDQLKGHISLSAPDGSAPAQPQEDMPEDPAAEDDNTGERPGCPSCGSTHVIKNGRRGGKQGYVCKDCNASFSV